MHTAARTLRFLLHATGADCAQVSSAVASAIMSQPKTKMLGMPREMRAPARSDDMDLDEASSEEEHELDEDEYDDCEQGKRTVLYLNWPSAA
jgi:hypothetical protein